MRIEPPRGFFLAFLRPNLFVPLFYLKYLKNSAIFTNLFFNDEILGIQEPNEIVDGGKHRIFFLQKYVCWAKFQGWQPKKELTVAIVRV